MRRERNQDKYIKLMLTHPLLKSNQKIWLVYWFMDRKGYARCLSTTEKELGISASTTRKRIIKDLMHLNILKRIGGKNLGRRETPIYDFTEDFEVQVAEFSKDQKGYWLEEDFTLPFDEKNHQGVQQISRIDPNNKGTIKPKKQEEEFSSIDYQEKYPPADSALIKLGLSGKTISVDPTIKLLTTR